MAALGAGSWFAAEWFFDRVLQAGAKETSLLEGRGLAQVPAAQVRARPIKTEHLAACHYAEETLEWAEREVLRDQVRQDMPEELAPSKMQPSR